MAALKALLRPGALTIFPTISCSPDERNQQRYQQHVSEFGTYGVFRLPEGAVVQTWTEQSVKVDAPSSLQAVVYSGGRFFVLSTFRTLLSSADGERWTSIDLVDTVMPTDVTFGEGRHLLVGSGAPQLSSDGVVWRSAPMDCSLPGACIQDPSGNTLQSIHYRAVFAEGRYYIDQASSADGQTWQMLPELYPQAYVGGYLLGNRARTRS